MSVDRLIRPTPGFRQLPASERRRTASKLLDLFHRLHRAHDAMGPPEGATVRQLIAWTGIKQDIEFGLRTWRAEMHHAREGAGRSPAIKGQGWPASASAGGPSRRALPALSEDQVTPENGFSAPSKGKNFQ